MEVKAKQFINAFNCSEKNGCVKPVRRRFHTKLKLPTIRFKQQPLSDVFGETQEIGNANFSSAVYNQDGTVYNHPITMMFREDINCKPLQKYFHRRYFFDRKVNTYVAGGSIGYESYTWVIVLRNKFGESVKKFFPIKTFDINKNIVDEAKVARESDNVLVQPDSRFDDGSFISPFKKGCHDLNIPKEEMEKYMTVVNEATGSVKLTKLTTDPVQFEHADLLNYLERIDEKHKSILFCRNMMPYIPTKQYENLAKYLYDKLKKGSCVILGDFDWNGGSRGMKKGARFADALKRAGFKVNTKCGVENTYEHDFEAVFEKN